MRQEHTIQIIRYQSPPPFVQTPRDAVGNGYIASKSKSDLVPTSKVMLEQYDYPDLLQEITLRIVERLRQQNYQNLTISNQPLAVPVSEDLTHYKRRFTSGLVLEISADPMGYGFMYLASNWQTYQPTISAQARMIRLNDMKVLWQGKCTAYSGKDSSLTFSVEDFSAAQGMRAKQVIKKATNLCGDELAASLLGQKK